MYGVRMMAVILAAGLFGGLGAGPARAQTSLDTQKDAPPTPNAAAPEYAPTPLTPAKASAIETVPGTRDEYGESRRRRRQGPHHSRHACCDRRLGRPRRGGRVRSHFGAMTGRPARWLTVSHKYRSRHE